MTDFRGIALPEGVEKRILYNSTFRVIATYAMSLADLDRELQHVLKARGSVIKEDCRQGLSGRIDVVTSSNELVHVLTGPCTNAAFVQLKMWVAF